MDELFSKIVDNIKSASNIIVTTHSSIDMDGFASCIVIKSIAQKYDKICHILIEDNNFDSAIQKILDDDYVEITTIKKISREINDETLLIILDTHLQILLQNPDIVNKVNKIIIIDHHIKNANYINNTILSYINSNMSSIAEIMTSFIEYEQLEIDSVLATLLLIGIEIDTNNFNVKTTEKTYQAASYLSKIGADNVYKQTLLKENIDNYIKRQDFIKNSYMINENMAMCTIDTNLCKQSELAKIADELLQFDNVEASFAIGKIAKNTVGISARSIGKIDVQKIMEKLGGGGHLTDAACQLEMRDINKAKEEVLKAIKE